MNNKEDRDLAELFFQDNREYLPSRLESKAEYNSRRNQLEQDLAEVQVVLGHNAKLLGNQVDQLKANNDINSRFHRLGEFNPERLVSDIQKLIVRAEMLTEMLESFEKPEEEN